MLKLTVFCSFGSNSVNFSSLHTYCPKRVQLFYAYAFLDPSYSHLHPNLISYKGNEKYGARWPCRIDILVESWN